MESLYAMQQDARRHAMAFVFIAVWAIATRRLNHGSPFPVRSGGVTIRMKTVVGADVSGFVTKMKSKKDATINVPSFNPLHGQGEGPAGNFPDRLLN